MKNSKLFSSTVGGVDLLIALASFSSCVYLGARSHTASAAREKSYQFILYKESSRQEKTAPGLSRSTPQQGQIDQTYLLGGTGKTELGRLPMAIRW